MTYKQNKSLHIVFSCMLDVEEEMLQLIFLRNLKWKARQKIIIKCVVSKQAQYRTADVQTQNPHSTPLSIYAHWSPVLQVKVSW